MTAFSTSSFGASATFTATPAASRAPSAAAVSNGSEATMVSALPSSRNGSTVNWFTAAAVSFCNASGDGFWRERSTVSRPSAEPVRRART